MKLRGRVMPVLFQALAGTLDHVFGNGNFPTVFINDGPVEIPVWLLAVQIHG